MFLSIYCFIEMFCSRINVKSSPATLKMCSKGNHNADDNIDIYEKVK